jgi:hypothetical protein
MSVGPVDHLARVPLPWRPAAELTECGKQLADFPAERIVSIAWLQARIRDAGKQRAAFSTCMVCWETAERLQRAGVRTPVGAVARVLDGLQYARPPVGPPERRGYTAALRAWERRRQVEAEIEALAALVAAHREEFDGYVDGIGETVSLAERRHARRAARS